VTDPSRLPRCGPRARLFARGRRPPHGRLPRPAPRRLYRPVLCQPGKGAEREPHEHKRAIPDARAVTGRRPSTRLTGSCNRPGVSARFGAARPDGEWHAAALIRPVQEQHHPTAERSFFRGPGTVGRAPTLRDACDQTLAIEDRRRHPPTDVVEKERPRRKSTVRAKVARITSKATSEVIATPGRQTGSESWVAVRGSRERAETATPTRIDQAAMRGVRPAARSARDPARAQGRHRARRTARRWQRTGGRSETRRRPRHRARREGRPA
jgi:hypothetical protein